MKKLILLVIFISCITKIQAQNFFDKNWILGDSVGVTFTSSGLVPFKAGMFDWEANASISDKNGNLLFYGDGCNIWDRNGVVMDNGDETSCDCAVPDYTGSSVTQGVLVLPLPDSDSLYYYFTLGWSGNCDNNSYVYYGLFYNIVDMSANGGLGKVVVKKQRLIGSSDSIVAFNPDSTFTEKLTAVKHGNGRDWWIYIHRYDSDEFIRFLLTPSGIQGPFTQHIGSVYDNSDDEGQMCVSENGKMLAAVGNSQLVNVFKIDRCSGLLYNFKDLTIVDSMSLKHSFFYGACLSPSGTKLYVSTFLSLIKQYSIDTSENNTSPADTGTILWIDPYYPDSSTGIIFGQLALGPDNRIYLKHCYYQASDTAFNDSINKSLSVINYPELAYPYCNFQLNGAFIGMDVSDYYISIGLPNFANLRLGALSESACDTLTGTIQIKAKEQEIEIYPNPTNEQLIIGDSYISLNNEQIQIMDLLGQSVIVQNIIPNSKQIAIDVRKLIPGLYFIIIPSINGNLVRKFIKD